MIKCRRALPDRRGATMVEFSMLLSFIVMFSSLTIEVSRVLMFQHAADTAAYEAAREGMVPGATSAEARDAGAKLLESVGLRSYTITVNPEVITEETGFITVTVDVPVALNSWVAPSKLTDYTVSSEVTLVCERPPMVRLTALPNLKKAKANNTNTDTDDDDTDG